MSLFTDVETVSTCDHLSAERSLALLKQVFGYTSFRAQQADIVAQVLAGKDAVVVMPTGGGKSLCYQLPALQLEGTCIVVSPLISLMQDQVMALRQLGVAARYWNSVLRMEDVKELVGELKAGQLDLLYLAPERLMMEGFDELLQQCRISLIAIDEAHCISEWGHEFRGDYRHLYRLKQQLPKVPIIALTATATPRVVKDIYDQLQIEDAAFFQSSFDRENLFYEIRAKANTFQQILHFIQDRSGQAGIIYAQSRKQVMAISEKLQQKGILALPYHAGLSVQEREANQEAFIHDRVAVIVATIAFGMGINKPDVRFVIHHDLPKTIENYYQETGRAGRDGEASHCLLFFSYGDTHKYLGFIEQMDDATERKHAQHKLQQMSRFVSQPLCRRKQLLQYFEEVYPKVNCQRCDICVNPPKMRDVTLESQKILSCIYRVKQRFGAQMIVDVLKGKSSPKITQYGLDTLSVYGIEESASIAQLRDMIQYLTFIEAVKVVGTEYPVLALGSEAKQILKGEKTVTMPVFQGPKQLDKRVTSSKGTGVGFASGSARELYGRLRSLRTRLAKEKGVPPYIIFHDRSLKEMAVEQPQDLQALLMISGVGETKAQRYGQLFLAAIRE